MIRRALLAQLGRSLWMTRSLQARQPLLAAQLGAPGADRPVRRARFIRAIPLDRRPLVASSAEPEDADTTVDSPIDSPIDPPMLQGRRTDEWVSESPEWPAVTMGESPGPNPPDSPPPEGKGGAVEPTPAATQAVTTDARPAPGYVAEALARLAVTGAARPRESRLAEPATGRDEPGVMIQAPTLAFEATARSATSVLGPSATQSIAEAPAEARHAGSSLTPIRPSQEPAVPPGVMPRVAGSVALPGATPPVAVREALPAISDSPVELNVPDFGPADLTPPVGPAGVAPKRAEAADAIANAPIPPDAPSPLVGMESAAPPDEASITRPPAAADTPGNALATPIVGPERWPERQVAVGPAAGDAGPADETADRDATDAAPVLAPGVASIGDRRPDVAPILAALAAAAIDSRFGTTPASADVLSTSEFTGPAAGPSRLGAADSALGTPAPEIPRQPPERSALSPAPAGAAPPLADPGLAQVSVARFEPADREMSAAPQLENGGSAQSPNLPSGVGLWAEAQKQVARAEAPLDPSLQAEPPASGLRPREQAVQPGEQATPSSRHQIVEQGVQPEEPAAQLGELASQPEDRTGQAGDQVAASESRPAGLAASADPTFGAATPAPIELAPSATPVEVRMARPPTVRPRPRITELSVEESLATRPVSAPPEPAPVEASAEPAPPKPERLPLEWAAMLGEWLNRDKAGPATPRDAAPAPAEAPFVGPTASRAAAPAPDVARPIAPSSSTRAGAAPLARYLADRPNEQPLGHAAEPGGASVSPVRSAVVPQVPPVLPTDRDAPTPIPESTRRFLRPLVGMDPASARLHDGAPAAELAARHQADALAVGDDVVLGVGQATGSSPESLGLVAHELTHVARQRSARFVPPVLAGSPATASLDEEPVARAVEARVRRLAEPGLERTEAAADSAVVPGVPYDADGQPVPNPPTPRVWDWNGLPAPWEALPDWIAGPNAPAVGLAGDASAGELPASGEGFAGPAGASGSGSTGAVVQAAARGRRLPSIEAPVRSTLESTPAETGSARGPEPDLDALARQVYSILKKRLAAERRRQGAV